MLGPKNQNKISRETTILPLEKCLAKTIHSESGAKPGVSVETHCRVVGYTARELITRLPPWLAKELFPQGSELVAAAHDVGKVCPTFQEKIHLDIGLPLGFVDPNLDSKIGYHFSVSQAAVEHSAKYIPEIMGRHHGYTPGSIGRADDQCYGGCGWQTVRLDLIDRLKREFNTDWPAISSPVQADAISGLTTVADWVGSGPMFDSVSPEQIAQYVKSAADNAGFIAPKLRKGLTFEEIFGFSPRELQVRSGNAIKAHGAYVIEAPMGIGKTEAALYAAYRVLEQGDATGIYFALPTQLTSDKIFERMNAFLAGDAQKGHKGILDESSANHSSLLLHGLAWLRDTQLGEDGIPGHAWFNSSKRGLLAPFAVGTVDQALMAVMNVKHGFVRTFGLAGKVVILDEVHSYDSYTGTILKELVVALRQLHCTVIILSATLVDRQRYSILGAEYPASQSKAVSAYPLISEYCPDGIRANAVDSEAGAQVQVRLSPPEGDTINEVLARAQNGEHILWIENIVADAQHTYRVLAARAKEAGVDCGLLHSRFIKTDRRHNEDKWVSYFGKAGFAARKGNGRILVGSPVLEQSLDIDADFLVTRICPTDMLFQRIGRLWRHRDNDAVRPVYAKREVWILAPDLPALLKSSQSLGKTAKVYSPYVLYRTAEVWHGKTLVNLPVDIRPLLEATYAERSETGILGRYKNELIRKRDSLASLALAGLSRGGKTLPESKASTRYSDLAVVEVLLVKKHQTDAAGVKIRLLDGTELLIPAHSEPAERRKIACALLQNTVSVPEYQAPRAISVQQLAGFKEYVYLGDNEESPFRLAIVSDSGALQDINCSGSSDKYFLAYNSRMGYIAKKKTGANNE